MLQVQAIPFDVAHYLLREGNRTAHFLPDPLCAADPDSHGWAEIAPFRVIPVKMDFDAADGSELAHAAPLHPPSRDEDSGSGTDGETDDGDSATDDGAAVLADADTVDGAGDGDSGQGAAEVDWDEAVDGSGTGDGTHQGLYLLAWMKSQTEP